MKLLTYTGIYDNQRMMRREYWYKSFMWRWVTAAHICTKITAKRGISPWGKYFK